MPIDFPAKRFVAGQTIRLDSGVRNSGYEPTDVFNVKWFVDGREVGAYGSHLGVPPLVWEKDGNSLFEWTPSSPGAHEITFLVDADDHVRESVEENNDRSVIVWVS